LTFCQAIPRWLSLISRQFSSTGRKHESSPSKKEQLDHLFLSGKDIDYSELETLVHSGDMGPGKEYVLIDVRNPEETSQGMIPNAVPLPCTLR
jgi:hypothetical protein